MSEEGVACSDAVNCVREKSVVSAFDMVNGIASSQATTVVSGPPASAAALVTRSAKKRTVSKTNFSQEDVLETMLRIQARRISSGLDDDSPPLAKRMSLPSSSPPGCVSSMKMEVESASSNGGIPVENHTGGNGENDMDEASSTVKSSSSASRMSNSGSECSLPPSGLIQPPPREGPDPDGIKMFVGQVPKSMDEKDLKKMFEEFGEVYQINVLRDKVTKQSKVVPALSRTERKTLGQNGIQLAPCPPPHLL
ncbi:unnamed protein product [Cyprideis torosa]|uniref:Uncharacterized protein n=1 Tax=Cyprideis torosa TaxID=163714 RepID=A0A7R8W326_9CRUS|nr:unnamed protein product [Cyprideis torosa]CAG0882601.1 unnamed protein product [Cyprideis torosa]